MPNVKSLKALKKLMQDEGLLRQIQQMSTVPDKHGIISGQAIEALNFAQKKGLDSPRSIRELREARRDGIRQDTINALQDEGVLKSDLTDRINAIGNEDRWTRAGGVKGERSLGATETYGGIPNKQKQGDAPFEWKSELKEFPYEEVAIDEFIENAAQQRRFDQIKSILEDSEKKIRKKPTNALKKYWEI